MKTINLTINSRAYQMACADGQEERLHLLSKYLNERIRNSIPVSTGETMALVMMCLLLADELVDAKAKLDEGAKTSSEPKAPIVAVQAVDGDSLEKFQRLKDRIDQLINFVEKA